MIIYTFVVVKLTIGYRYISRRDGYFQLIRKITIPSVSPRNKWVRDLTNYRVNTVVKKETALNNKLILRVPTIGNVNFVVVY